MKSDINSRLESFFSNYKKITFKKGDIIIRGDDEPNGVYFVKSGYVKMSSIYEDGSEISANIFKPNSYFPMVWVLGDIENTYFYKALNTVETYKAPKDDVLNFLKLNTSILLDLTSRMLVGFESMLNMDKKIIKANSLQKVAIIIEMLCTRFGMTNANGQIEISIPTTHQDIANFAGISRETASIAIGKLREENIIKTTTNKIEILDLQKIKSTASSK